ncbi:MAG: super-infection exclusion protein B [Ignavibacteria bacterium]|nr:super-infection exclusion protein B [Ignavibacteria bacterium]
MQNSKLSRKTKVASLSPIMVAAVTMIATEIFSTASQKWADSLGGVIGYKLLILTCLFLAAGMVSMYILQSSRVQIDGAQPDAHNPVPPVSQPSESEIRKRRERLLHNLAEDEKETLRLFIEGNKKCIRITYGYGSVASLMRNGILYVVNQVSVHGTLEYSISDWAWEELRDNPKYLK